MPLPVATYKGPVYSSFVTLSSRIKSYSQDFWTRDLIEFYSKSGFYFCSLTNKPICFYCGLRLENYGKHINPWLSHRFLASKCTYINLNYTLEVSQTNTCTGYFRKLWSDIKTLFQKERKDSTVVDYIRDISCKVCMENIAEYVFLPCGHLVTCLNCSTTQHICPICRVQIASILRIFV